MAAISEAVSIACARTVVAEDNELFLGELGMTYLSAAPKNVSLFFFMAKFESSFLPFK